MLVSHLVDDLADLWLKAHVQHAVCLIQHQVGHPLQISHAGLQHVYQAPCTPSQPPIHANGRWHKAFICAYMKTPMCKACPALGTLSCVPDNSRALIWADYVAICVVCMG